MTPDTEVLYAVAGLAAPATSSIYKHRVTHERTHEPVQVSIAAGTATISIEGRTGPNEPWIALATVSASDIILVPTGLELRVNVTAAAAASIRVVASRPLLFVA